METVKSFLIRIIRMMILRPIGFIAGFTFALIMIVIGRFDIVQNWIAEYEFKKVLKDEDDRHDRFAKYYGR